MTAIKESPLKISYGLALQLIVIFFAGCGFYFTVLNDITSQGKDLSNHQKRISELESKFNTIAQSLVKIEGNTQLTNYRLDQMEKVKR
jgi:hypothetical protein